MARKKKHAKKRSRSQSGFKTRNHQYPFWIYEAVAGGLLIIGYMLSLSPFHKKLAVAVFLAAWVLAGLGVAIKLWHEFSEPARPPLPKNDSTEARNLPRPRFSEKFDMFRVGVASNLIILEGMSDGHSEPILEIRGKPVATARLVNDECVIDAKLGIPGAELKDNRLINKPFGWDWNADDTTFEVVNERGSPMLQLIYLGGDVVLVRGVFSDGETCWVLEQQDMFRVPFNDQGIRTGSIGLTPIFKYPRYQHPHERVMQK